MILSVVCGYPSKSQGTYEEFLQQEFDANKFVNAVKRKPINGYVDIQLPGKLVRINGSEGGFENAMKIAGWKMANILHRLALGDVALVPVPSSSHVQYGQPFTGSKLCDAMASNLPSAVALPGLFFAEQTVKAADGGTRNPDVIEPLLRWAGPQPDRTIVLIDDVSTTGGHLIACARYLSKRGFQPPHAICLAQTVWSPPDDIFALPAVAVPI